MRELIRLTAIASMALMLGGETALAQDDAYTTPKKANERYEQKRQEIRQRRKQGYTQRQDPTARRYTNEYEQMVDSYNRRGKVVTISEVTGNDTLMVSTDAVQSVAGLSSTLNSRLGIGPNSNTIVLPNVDRVIMLDDLDYDAWSDTYYGRDTYSNSFVTINNSPTVSSYMDFYRGYYPWRDSYYWAWDHPYYYNRYMWGYPWYHSRWYRPWYGWGYYGHGWSVSFYDPWDYYGRPYYGYNHGYYDGYYDGAYSHSRHRNNYNSYGRSVGRYYDRRSTGNSYGRVLGRDSEYANQRNSYGGYYGGSYNSGRNSSYNSNQRNSTVNSGWTNRNSYSSPSRSSSSSYGNSSNHSSSPSRSTGGGGNSGGTSRVRR